MSFNLSNTPLTYEEPSSTFSSFSSIIWWLFILLITTLLGFSVYLYLANAQYSNTFLQFMNDKLNAIFRNPSSPPLTAPKPPPPPPPKKKNEKEYKEDDSSSSIQQKNKGGFCYIGQDRGIRSCALVNESDTCVSGEIFPTMEICINPTLRE